MTFNDYLKSKKIDPDLFKLQDPKLYNQFSSDFDQMNPNSFTAQKLFLINSIRRKNTFSGLDKDNESKSKPKKPKITPRIKK
jgi:hypothetical protein